MSRLKLKDVVEQTSKRIGRLRSKESIEQTGKRMGRLKLKEAIEQAGKRGKSIPTRYTFQKLQPAFMAKSWVGFAEILGSKY